ncbi:uncharacterized protein UDID_18703 [Ustilago sp. UG-2017a]|nr:uncharacterized protein UDID_18703 [Ustilago sp. UG-2017a]
MEDKDLVINLFQGSLTCSLQEKFEQNPPTSIWEWYREVEDIDHQQMMMQQSASRHPGAVTPRPDPVARLTPSGPPQARPPGLVTSGALYQFGSQPLPPHLTQNLRPRDTTLQDSNTCHWCRGTGLSEVTCLKPVICSRTTSITDLVEICDCICSVAILVKLCCSDVPMTLLAQICDWSNAIADFD